MNYQSSHSLVRVKNPSPGAAALALAACLAATSLVACSNDDPTPPPGPTVTLPGSSAPSLPPATDADWTTYHHDSARTGVASGVTTVGKLAKAWEARLDGAVYGQPLVVGDLVFAATEGDTVYALQAATGTVVWSVHVGTPVPRS